MYLYIYVHIRLDRCITLRSRGQSQMSGKVEGRLEGSEGATLRRNRGTHILSTRALPSAFRHSSAPPHRSTSASRGNTLLSTLKAEAGSSNEREWGGFSWRHMKSYTTWTHHRNVINICACWYICRYMYTYIYTCTYIWIYMYITA